MLATRYLLLATSARSAALQTEFVQPGLATGVHDKGESLERSVLVGPDKHGNILVDALHLLEQRAQFRLGGGLAVERKHAGLVDADGHGALELVFTGGLDLGQREVERRGGPKLHRHKREENDHH